MARFWKEQYNEDKHRNHMEQSSSAPYWVYFVVVCGFTFEFHSLEQISKCLEYYSKKHHPSSRRSMGSWGGDKREARKNMFACRWQDRLPQHLLKESKRQKVIKALAQALTEF